MEVSIIPFNSEEVINKIYTACRTCYSAGTPQEQYAKAGEIDNEKKWKLIKHVLNSGHFSTLEHVQFTFMISGVSRSLSHQLVRHRMSSYSQQSQRYCEFKDGKFDYVTPKKLKSAKKAEALALYDTTMKTLSAVYAKLIEYGLPAEDARMVLPNACCTNLTMSCNLRELIHICNERMCICAQQEIREMVTKMAKLVTEQIPELKPYLDSKCVGLGYCNESAQRSCGKFPLKEQVLKTDK